ncbi:MAG: hypothetical protein IJ574_01025 [Bacilli bacterium]|nr:hypothetical protein [Bacilli bacterium]
MDDNLKENFDEEISTEEEVNETELENAEEYEDEVEEAETPEDEEPIEEPDEVEPIIEEEPKNEIEQQAKEIAKESTSKVKKFFNFILVLLIFVWLCLLVTDFLRVKDEKQPIFCLKEVTKKYDDGEVYICTGILYKVYKYDRDSISAREFGPFFIKERTEAVKTK